eukprot:4606467-Amphidinium_carterae.1
MHDGTPGLRAGVPSLTAFTQRTQQWVPGLRAGTHSMLDMTDYDAYYGLCNGVEQDFEVSASSPGPPNGPSCKLIVSRGWGPCRTRRGTIAQVRKVTTAGPWLTCRDPSVSRAESTGCGPWLTCRGPGVGAAEVGGWSPWLTCRGSGRPTQTVRERDARCASGWCLKTRVPSAY